jgi:hypothetical protein
MWWQGLPTGVGGFCLYFWAGFGAGSGGTEENQPVTGFAAI